MIDKILIIIAFVMSSVSQAAGILAFGDLRGHIEPCGCDPATDLGGIKRLATFFAWERQYRPDVVVVSLGNLTDPEGDEIKNKFIMEAVFKIAPDVSLLNRTELQTRSLAQYKKLPFVLSNRRGQSAADYIDKGDKRFFGYVTPVGGDLVSWQDAKFQQLIKAVDVARRVLLFSGSQSDLEAIVKAKIFSEIIASSVKPLTTLPGRDERDSESVLQLVSDPSVWSVPLGGTGVLRLGNAATEVPPKIGDLFVAPKVGNATKEILQLAKVTPVSWLLKEEPAKTSPVDDVYTSYEKAITAKQKKSALVRAQEFKDSEFVGATACLACHPTSVVTHSASKHAEAFTTLKNKKKEHDPECLSCHVVGLNVKGGFVSEGVSPGLAGVQCENCHGPRRAHIQTKKPTEESHGGWVCEQCHNAQHSPNFQREAYWQKIKHSRETP